MRTRVLLLLSLAMNLFLAVGWFLAPRPSPSRRLLPPRRPVITTNVVRMVRTNLIVHPRVFSWDEIESSDYLTYIDNLRAIGCPKSTIRDIIVADVNQLFGRRRAMEIVTTTQQWWRSDPDLDVLQESTDKLQALDEERRELLARLLGPGWELPAELAGIPNSSIAFDGPVLSGLSQEAREAVLAIELEARDRQAAYMQAQRKAGKPADPAELARLRQSAREDLAKVLKPEELEEYLLRYSRNADRLRESLRGFGTSQEEFRKLFRATDAIDYQLQTLGDTSDPASVKRREELERAREDAVKEALPTERYEYLRLNRDPAFQETRDTAEQIGAAAETVLPLYQINRATEQERQRILQDASLTPEQQSEQLGAIYQHQVESQRKLLGEEAFKKLQETKGN